MGIYGYFNYLSNFESGLFFNEFDDFLFKIFTEIKINLFIILKFDEKKRTFMSHY